jgi:hypothetical protein
MAQISEEEAKEIRQACYELVQQKEYENAKDLIDRLLNDDPNDAAALNFLGIIHLDLQNFHLGYQYFRRALQEKPGYAPIWTNFGLSAHELGRNKEAMSAYLKSAELDNNYYKAYDNAAALLIEESKWDEAEKMCNLSLEIDPDGSLAPKNLAHVYLAQHKWAEGWKRWEMTLGCKFRKEWVYGDEKRWDGAKDKAVVIYGEQGLGDEINFASCVPDAIADCKKVIIDCDPRLETLFKRSFPKADVHGTRRDDQPEWLKNAKIDARCASSSLPAFYRNKDEDFPGTPYLVPNPDLVKMFKAYFEKLGKPVYGLCMNSGSSYTGEKYRKIEPEDFSPILGMDAVFINLDYKGDATNPRIMRMDWATRAKDYDVTAALIASMDGLIGINTTAMHCANGLGVPTHIMVPDNYQWRYEGVYVWSKTCTVHHKNGRAWREVVKEINLK